MCVFVYLSGGSHGKESKEKTTWPRQSNTKSLEKRELLFFKGERKEGKSGRARVGYLGVCLSTPANEKLLSIFHHTHTRESFVDSPI